jgi:histidine triad (HIT) family protein
MEDCIFCKIVAKKIPAKVVYEDDHLLAFDDIRPQAPTHVLVIPKDHFASLNDVPPDQAGLLGRMLLAARRVAAEKGVDRSGYRLVINTARDSGQDVFHIHVHLLGGRRMTWPPG